MIYLVSSFYRSGTSMMMRCLDAGGMDISYTRRQTNYVALHGYEPTPGGIYETAVAEFRKPDFTQVYDGKAVKIPLHMLLGLPKHEYSLIFMLRNPASIRKSMFRYAPTALFPNEELTWFYPQVVDALMDKLASRGDFRVLKLGYEDVMDNPVAGFEQIRDFGFPIDVEKAVRLVDARLQRNAIQKG
jgi:hypothetical protein